MTIMDIKLEGSSFNRLIHVFYCLMGESGCYDNDIYPILSEIDPVRFPKDRSDFNWDNNVRIFIYPEDKEDLKRLYLTDEYNLNVIGNLIFNASNMDSCSVLYLTRKEIQELSEVYEHGKEKSELDCSVLGRILSQVPERQVNVFETEENSSKSDYEAGIMGRLVIISSSNTRSVEFLIEELHKKIWKDVGESIHSSAANDWTWTACDDYAEVKGTFNGEPIHYRLNESDIFKGLKIEE